MVKNDNIEFLESRLPFWHDLTEEQKNLLISSSTVGHYEKGQSITGYNSECVGLIIVKTGTLRIYMTSEDGREVTLYRIEPGEVCVFSASCVLKTINFDVYIVAQSECYILEIDSLTFSQLFKENMHVELYAYKLATERFSDVMWSMQQILFTSFDKRLASFLLDESLNTGSDILYITHEEIAKHVGSAREVVSRMLKYFSNEGMVGLSRGKITITNKGRLRSLL
ncbi:CRP/FNR family transcriptional regulator, anaerobic regulatory protein [Hathewaya proteolytica DSM 3090]|uniref:CRP/FNR family transcriptional regulator, anaerobic regulatory protein n=1 Tax=Hathewaya proteolytica DSM 3090 TaxID=1121331 RepID=A0A1M6QKT0_9CLOT|nr:CRP/FNR family transcriptional regulator, anaerobic regulatory protein [Hathewaya proteolytica DSM 3090]